MRTEKENLIIELRENFKEEVEVIETNYQPLDYFDEEELEVLRDSLGQENREDIDTIVNFCVPFAIYEIYRDGK